MTDEPQSDWRELPGPIFVGEMTKIETNAIHDADHLIEQQSRRVELESRLLEAAAWRKRALLNEIAERHGLEVNLGQFSFDEDSGRIFQTHQLYTPIVGLAPVEVKAQPTNHREEP